MVGVKLPDRPASEVASTATPSGAGDPAAGKASPDPLDAARKPEAATLSLSAPPGGKSPPRRSAGLAPRLTALLARLPFQVVEAPARSDGPKAAGSATRWAATRTPGRQVKSADWGPAAGRVFARLTVAPVIVVVAWLITGVPLLLAGYFQPVPMLLISAPLATAIAVNVLHRVPDRWPAVLPGPSRRRNWTAWWALIGTVAVAVGFTVWELAMNSPSVIVTRTPGAYLQAGYWLAQHGSLPITQSSGAFGGQPGLYLSSIGFAQVGQSIAPTVVAGLPMLLAAGFWTSGISGGLVVPPVLGGFAVLCFGGLVGRLVGRQWAPAGALVLALSLPQLYVSRDAFAEPVIEILLFGGLCLLIDALTLGRKQGAARHRRPGGPPAPRRARRRHHRCYRCYRCYRRYRRYRGRRHA